MSSTVTNYSNNINVLYPIPGVDNDTQGFRDNFSSIKNALQATAQELSNLNLNTSKLNTGENDYSYSARIYRAPLKAVGYTVGEADTLLDADDTVSFLSGHYHRFTVDGNVKLSVTDWPEGLYSKVLFEIKNYNTASNSITFDAYGSTLKSEASLTLPHTLSTSTTTSHMFQLWTADRGRNVFVQFLGTYTNV